AQSFPGRGPESAIPQEFAMRIEALHNAGWQGGTRLLDQRLKRSGRLSPAPRGRESRGMLDCVACAGTKSSTCLRRVIVVWWIVGIVVAVVLGYVVWVYNQLVSLTKRADAAWSDIDVQLKRRWDL